MIKQLTETQINLLVIYVVYNLINGKRYVGLTEKGIEYRKRRHLNCAFGSPKRRSYFHRAINKYGVENFIWIVQEVCVSSEDLSEREKYWISFYHSDNPKYGYNLTSGGRSGYSFSAITRRKLSQANRGRKHSLETREKHSKARKGKQHSLLHRERIGKAHLGMKRSVQAKINISKSHVGNTNCVGRVVSKETRMKMRNAHIGKHNKKVKCVDTGVIYESIKFAGQCVGIAPGGISKACRHPNIFQQAGGLHWEYVCEN